MTEERLADIERFTKDHFRPCSDTYPRMMEMIEHIRQLHGWADPKIPLPTLDEFIAAREARGEPMS